MSRLMVVMGVVLAGGVAGAEAPIQVEGTLGYLDQASVQRAVDERAQAFDACFHSQAEKLRYLGGEAKLRIRVGRDGAVKKAFVENGDLGSWAIEKCLLRQTRTMAFGNPRGGDAFVEVPLQFIAWSPADDGDGAELQKKLSVLGNCTGSHGEVTVIAYAGPGGRIKSVGFAGDVSEEWADCAAKKTMALRVRDPRGRMLKLTGKIP